LPLSSFHKYILVLGEEYINYKAPRLYQLPLSSFHKYIIVLGEYINHKAPNYAIFSSILLRTPPLFLPSLTKHSHQNPVLGTTSCILYSESKTQRRI
jgi:hypothetical protein